MHPSDGQGGAVGLHQHAILHPVRLEEFDRLADDVAGALAYLADALGLVLVLGGAGYVNQRRVKVAIDLNALQLRVQRAELHPGAASIRHPVKAHPSAHFQVGEYAAVQLDDRCQPIGFVAQDAHKVVLVHIHDGESAGGGFVPLNRRAQEQRLLSPLLDHVPADSAIGHIVHCRVGVYFSRDDYRV